MTPEWHKWEMLHNVVRKLSHYYTILITCILYSYASKLATKSSFISSLDISNV